MQARIKAIRWEAEDILSFILEPVGGGLMPAFDPGAHIDVQLARACRAATRWPMIRRSAGLTRSASTFADQPGRFAPYPRALARGRYHRDFCAQEQFPDGRGRPHTVLIAGGIGITPMLPMIARSTGWAAAGSCITSPPRPSAPPMWPMSRRMMVLSSF
jgi:vanillate O-demethylase ferredoxin subunit